MLPTTLSMVEISALMPTLTQMSIWLLLEMLKAILENRRVKLRKNPESVHILKYPVTRMES